MKCEEIRGIISLYIDNELNEQDRMSRVLCIAQKPKRHKQLIYANGRLLS